MQKILVFLFLISIVSSCNTSENKGAEKTTETQNPDQGEIYLPSLTMDEMEILWKTCNQVDYLYYELPVSTSLDDKYSIQQGLRHISEDPVPLAVKNNCKPLARIFYKNEGEDLMEAELYFASGCTFYVFFKKGKPVFSNLMTDDGVKHFDDILKKAASFQRKQ